MYSKKLYLLITLNIVQKYFTFSCMILSCFSWSFINFAIFFCSLCLCHAGCLIFSNFCWLFNFYITLHTVPKIIHFFGKIVESVYFSRQHKMAAVSSCLCWGWSYYPPAPAEHIARKILSLESRRQLELNFRSRIN